MSLEIILLHQLGNHHYVFWISSIGLSIET